ncbi:MAG: aldehyde dehydrogenase family protein [Paracoccaceae bacterium]|nr:aldehyde dehydrogenase family protein [Paracoccaceae bacterium]
MIKELLWFPTNKCLIDGSWEAPTSKNEIALINPSDGTILIYIARGSKKDVENAVSSAQRALKTSWGKKNAHERGQFLLAMSKLVIKYQEKLAFLESLDVGKPLSQATKDVTTLARYLEFYGGAADKIHGITIPFQNDFTVIGLRERLGVTAHIIPWNYPMQIIGRSISASLAMGNACVLKPSEEACLTALAFGEIAREAGLPDGALNIVPGFGSEAGHALASNKEIAHISFTGSLQTATLIQMAAAQNIVGTTLELGGKSPQIVFDDANFEKAVPFLVNAGIQNAGQTCSASSRILVQQGSYRTVVKKMSAAYKQLQVGPAIENLDLGPVISRRQMEIILSYRNKASDLKISAEGRITKNATKQGFYITPQLFETDNYMHPLAQEEIFGPIQLIIPFRDETEAIKIANSTEYGLVASVWTENGSRQMRVAKAVHAGQVFINNYGAGGGVELPFGGVGKSGHGREKGFEALYGFSQLKTIANFCG